MDLKELRDTIDQNIEKLPKHEPGAAPVHFPDAYTNARLLMENMGTVRSILIDLSTYLKEMEDK